MDKTHTQRRGKYPCEDEAEIRVPQSQVTGHLHEAAGC